MCNTSTPLSVAVLLPAAVRSTNALRTEIVGAVRAADKNFLSATRLLCIAALVKNHCFKLKLKRYAICSSE